MVPIDSSAAAAAEDAQAFMLQAEPGLKLVFDHPQAGREPGLDGYRLSIQSAGLTAAIQIGNGHRKSSPCALFEQMGREAGGWAGKIIWRAEAGEYCLSAAYAKAGYVVLTVEIEDIANGWATLAHLDIEPDQLAHLATQAQAFFGN